LTDLTHTVTLFFHWGVFCFPQLPLQYLLPQPVLIQAGSPQPSPVHSSVLAYAVVCFLPPFQHSFFFLCTFCVGCPHRRQNRAFSPLPNFAGGTFRFRVVHCPVFPTFFFVGQFRFLIYPRGTVFPLNATPSFHSNVGVPPHPPPNTRYGVSFRSLLCFASAGVVFLEWRGFLFWLSRCPFQLFPFSPASLFCLKFSPWKMVFLVAVNALTSSPLNPGFSWPFLFGSHPPPFQILRSTPAPFGKLERLYMR